MARAIQRMPLLPLHARDMGGQEMCPAAAPCRWPEEVGRMGARMPLVALAAVLAGAQVAPAANKDKLREALVHPNVTITMGFLCNADGVIAGTDAEIDTGEEATDIPAEVAAVEKAMTGDARDAERYFELSKLYRKAKDTAKAQDACDRAIPLYLRWLDTEPDRVQSLVALGELLWAADQTDKSETVLRRAVRVAPREWRAWISLGQVLGDRAVEALAGKDAAAAHRKDLERFLLAAGPPKATSPQQREQALKLLTEAGACFDRAVTLAPRERRPYLARAAARQRHALLRPLLSPERGQVPLDFDGFTASMAEALPDLKQVSRLDPKDYRALGAVAFYEMMIAFAARKDLATDTDFPPLPDSTRQALRKTLKKLEKLAQDPDQRTAAGAEEVSGLLLWMGLKSPHAAETHLRRAVLLRPSCEHAWDLLCAVAGAPQGASDHLIAIYKDRLKHKDSARGHLLLARAYEEKDPEKCEAEVRAALKLEPDNCLANLYLLVLLLRPGDDAALRKANPVLVHLGKVLQKGGETGEQWCDCTITWAIFEGLRDNVSGAKQIARWVLETDPKNERARRVLDALEE